MKRLVKSAKEQFNARLSELNDVVQVLEGGCLIYYTAIANNGIFVLLRQDGDEYREVIYESSYIDLVLSNNFLSQMALRFVGINRDIRTLFDWYATPDVVSEPFDLTDIMMLSIGKAIVYEDIYEEIPDNVVTAEQQFEEESKNAKEILPFLKVEQTSSNIIFYQNDKGDYYRFCYPSLEVMRKDKDFVFQMIKVMTNDFTKEDLSTFMNWVDEGGEFPFPLSVILSMEYYQNSSCYIYQDINIENLIKLTPEQQKAVDMIHEGIKMFKENGGDFVCYSCSDEWFAVNGWGVRYSGDEKNNFVDVSNMVEKQGIHIPLDIYWGADSALYAKPE